MQILDVVLAFSQGTLFLLALGLLFVWLDQ